MWITHPSSGYKEGKFVFKKTVALAKIPENTVINICADTKYRLYINGRLVCFGPAKQSPITAYYDTVDIGEYLIKGKNELVCEVLHLAAMEDTRSAYGDIPYTTLIRGALCQLMLEASIEGFTADASWQVSYCPEYAHNRNIGGLIAGFESIDMQDYKRKFVSARELCVVDLNNYINSYGEIDCKILAKRPIPMLTYIRRDFLPFKASNSFVLNADYENTGAFHLSLTGEKGATVKITYAESYYKRNEKGECYKDVRDDETGEIYEHYNYDTVTLADDDFEYETFCLRTFRFVKIEISGNAQVKDAYYYEIKYPLNVEAEFTSDDKDARALWEVSIRTLNNCMHDSFEDCPYYEQMQYAMDTRLQMNFLRRLTSDRALIRKAINDFKESRLPDGMIQARTPVARRQIIPGFALYYIFMIHDYFVYDGDREFIRSLMPTVDGIIDWYENHRNKEDGIVRHLGNWCFLDWVDGWKAGVPSHTEPMSVYNFMYSVALSNAIELAEFSGRRGLASEYREIRRDLTRNLTGVFYDSERGLYKDTPSGGYSMHSQMWAVLSGEVCDEKAKALMQRTLAAKDLSMCSHAMMYFVFRALEICDMYGEAYKYLDNWRAMLEKHCTTWIESGAYGRSDCHAWGSVPIYEFASCILGVKPFAKGTGEILVAPYVFSNEYASGKVSTPTGVIEVDWHKENGKLFLFVVSHASVPVYVILPDESMYLLKNNEGSYVCKL